MGIRQSRRRSSRSNNNTTNNNDTTTNNNMTSPENNRNNSNTDDNTTAASAETNSDRDNSLASVLSFLIRSGQVRLVRLNTDRPPLDSEEENLRQEVEQSLSDHGAAALKCLQESDVYLSTQIANGYFNGKTRHVTKRLSRRELGCSASRTSVHGQSDKWFVNTKLLPNKMTKVDVHRSKVFVGQYVRDGNVFVSAGQDQKIRFYNTTGSKYKCFKTIEARDVGWSVLDVAISPDGAHVIYSSWSDYVHQCSVYGDPENHIAFNLEPREYRFCCFSLRFSNDGDEILCGANDRCLYIYNREENRRTLRIEAHEDDVNAVCFADETSKIIYSGGDDGLVKVWDRRTLSEDDPKPVGYLAGHSDGITFIDSKGDSRYLISNSKDQSIKLWDVRKCSSNDAITETRRAVSRQLWDYRGQNVPRRIAQYIKGDTSVMTYSENHTVLHTLIRCFFSPTFTTGQQFIYCGCATGACVVYDLLTGKPAARLRGHQACVRDVSWHPYLNEICTSSWDASVGRWTYDGRDEDEREIDSSSDVEDDTSGDESDRGGGGRTGSGVGLGPRSSRLLRLYRRIHSVR